MEQQHEKNSALQITMRSRFTTKTQMRIIIAENGHRKMLIRFMTNGKNSLTLWKKAINSQANSFWWWGRDFTQARSSAVRFLLQKLKLFCMIYYHPIDQFWEAFRKNDSYGNFSHFLFILSTFYKDFFYYITEILKNYNDCRNVSGFNLCNHANRTVEIRVLTLKWRKPKTC